MFPDVVKYNQGKGKQQKKGSKENDDQRRKRSQSKRTWKRLLLPWDERLLDRKRFWEKQKNQRRNQETERRKIKRVERLFF